MARTLAILFAITTLALGGFGYLQTTKLEDVRKALSEATAERTKSDLASTSAQKAAAAAKEQASAAEDKAKASAAEVEKLKAELAQERQARMDAESRANRSPEPSAPAQPQ